MLAEPAKRPLNCEQPMSDMSALEGTVYQALRSLAAQRLLREASGNSLTPTELVHEAWLRIAKSELSFQDRNHYLRVAATAMRRILVDRARARLASKRGGEFKQVPLDDLASPATDEQLAKLDDALQVLAEKMPQHALLVELRFFCGMTGDDAAAALGVSPATADRIWRYARSWLQLEMNAQ
jgi:RNA polymerase sigma factor (TIGR02999 family)